jgi:hypothetical protein
MDDVCQQIAEMHPWAAEPDCEVEIAMSHWSDPILFVVSADGRSLAPAALQAPAERLALGEGDPARLATLPAEAAPHAIGANDE